MHHPLFAALSRNTSRILSQHIATPDAQETGLAGGLDFDQAEEDEANLDPLAGEDDAVQESGVSTLGDDSALFVAPSPAVRVLRSRTTTAARPVSTQPSPPVAAAAPARKKLAKKRKAPKPASDYEDLSVEEIAAPPLPKKLGRPKGSGKPKVTGDETPKRKPGRPHRVPVESDDEVTPVRKKSKRADIKSIAGRSAATEPPAAPLPLSITAFVEVSLPIRLVRARGGRSNAKATVEKPIPHGPITFDTSYTWKQLLVSIVNGLEPVSNPRLIPISSMTWRLSTPKTSPILILRNDTGFTALKLFVTGKQKSTEPTTFIHIAMDALLVNSLDFLDEEFGAVVAPSVVYQDNDDDTPSTVNLDRRLELGVQELEAVWKVGTCAKHPTIECAFTSPDGLHFALNRTRKRYWANTLGLPGHSVNLVPQGSNNFRPSDVIKDVPRTTVTPEAPPVSTAPIPPSSEGAVASLLSQYMQQILRPVYHQSSPNPYDWPASTPAHHPTHFPSAGYPPPPLPFGTPYTPPQYHAAPPDILSSPPPPATTLEDFCSEFALTPEEHDGLVKMRFRVGDRTALIPDNVWVDAGFVGMMRTHVVDADKRLRRRSAKARG